MYIGKTKKYFVLIAFSNDCDFQYNKEDDWFEIADEWEEHSEVTYDYEERLIVLSDDLAKTILKCDELKTPDVGEYVEVCADAFGEVEINRINSFSTIENNIFKSCIK